jgi:hypothetical protein
MDFEIFLWALAGGILVAVVSAAAIYSQKEEMNVKKLSRDFLIGAAFTGFFYPMIPETFQEIQGSMSDAAAAVSKAASSAASSQLTVDSDIKIGPPNF